MASIFSYIRRLFSPRSHQRLMVKNSTFVLVSPGTDKEQKVHVIDISEGGAAFIYEGSKEDLDTSGILKMIADDMSLEKIHFETVSDRPTSEPFRCRGIRFKWMGVLEKANLKSFIKAVGIAPE